MIAIPRNRKIRKWHDMCQQGARFRKQLSTAEGSHCRRCHYKTSMNRLEKQNGERIRQYTINIISINNVHVRECYACLCAFLVLHAFDSPFAYIEIPSSSALTGQADTAPTNVYDISHEMFEMDSKRSLTTAPFVRRRVRIDPTLAPI